MGKYKAIDKDLKQRWVAALRSGKYRQIPGALKSQGCYCALGVLCDVVDPEGWEDPQPGDWRLESVWKFQGERYVGELSGIGFLSKAFMTRLITLNDERDLPFDELADFIEKNLPEKEVTA